MLRFVLVVAFVVVAPASAQSHVVGRAGPVVSLDLAGGPFPAFTPAGVDASGSVGYRFGNGLDLTVLLGYGGPVDDERFLYPAELHIGADVGWVVGPDRAPWRLAVVGLATVSGATTFVFPADSGPTETRGGREVVETRARASAVRYLPLADGSVRAQVGVGLYGAVRELTASTLVFGAGGPDEQTVGGETRTETSVGAVVSLPVSLELGPAVLVLDPALRVDASSLIFGLGDGQVTLRLNL
ncbi:hypothetical protein [Rubrivirga sp. IMCC43871]|uniref:hypothetical protein n=1 Tax=Rubrivirga sp. IMCC43871 TaxID=3391575 RepID=UPI00398FDC77